MNQITKPISAVANKKPETIRTYRQSLLLLDEAGLSQEKDSLIRAKGNMDAIERQIKIEIINKLLRRTKSTDLVSRLKWKVEDALHVINRT